MGKIFNRISRATNVLRGKASSGGPLITTGHWNKLGGDDAGDIGTMDFEAQVRQFRSHVYACTTLRAQVAATVPLQIVVNRDGEEEIITDHRFLDTWNEVNPLQDRFEVMELIITYLCMTGNAYLLMNNDTLGLPTELWTLPSQSVKIVRSKERMIAGYELTVGPSKKLTFDAEDIIHFKLPNPFDPYYYGLSPVWAAAWAIGMQNNINTMEMTMIKNQGRPDLGIILKDGIDVTTEGFKRAKEEFIDTYCGPDKQGKPLFLGGVEDIKNFDFPIRDFAFLKGRSNIREDVYEVMKVPITFGSRDNSPARATMDADKARLIEYATKPDLIRIQERLNGQIMPRFDSRLSCKFDIESVIPADRDFRLKEIESHIKSTYSTVNEERAIDGKEDRPDGMGDKVLVSMNVIPADELGYVTEIEEEKVEAEEERTEELDGKALDLLIDRIMEEVQLEIQGKAKKSKTVSLGVDKIQRMSLPMQTTMRKRIYDVYKDFTKSAVESFLK